jgi:hypothetical protein
MGNASVRKLAISEASLLKQRIVSQHGVGDEVDDQVLSRSLANRLISPAQVYLLRKSDIGLFLEVHAWEPPDVTSWPVTILAAPRNRQTPEEDLQPIFDGAVEAAGKYVRSRPSLAWGR